MSRFLSGVLRVGGALALALLLVGVVAVAGMARRGLSAHDQPTAGEVLLARGIRSLSVPRAAKNTINPVPATAEALRRARAHFADHCASCHGNDGQGDTPLGRGLYPKAPDMTLRETQSRSDGEIFYIIENGIRLTGMPGWGRPGPEDDAETWELVHFIRRLPRMEPAEIEEMESLNPRTRQEWEEEAAIRKFLAEGGEIPSSPHH